jgi:hypothetical protein
MQLPLAPAESAKHWVTPVGFEPRLFASEPHLGGKPIAMNWDERGRLWLAVTVDYPNELQPDGKGRDRIVVCEDSDGDDVADRFTLFADGLSIATGLTFARGGVIVLQPPHTLFLKDTDGDGRADERRVLFTGWDTHDTHAGPSHLVHGLDNWVYGMVGYAGFKGTVGGEEHSFRQGYFRFLPDGSKLEFLRNNNNNCWGLGFSEEGLLFGSTANGNPSVHLPIPNRFYERVRGWSSSVLDGIADDAPMFPITDQVRQVDFHGRFTAAAGHALYTARAYPKPYWNRTAFVAEPTGHLLATFVLQPHGSTFRAKNAWNLVASDDEWSAPTMAEVGPDGHVWVIDWYNYIVQHNPTPPGFQTGKGNAYETDLRDKKHGRIYRIVYQPAPREAARDLRRAKPLELVALLRHENLFWRRHAQRLLVERGEKDIVPALLDIIQEPRIDSVGLDVGGIHALGVLDGLRAGGDDDSPAALGVYRAFRHPTPGVRMNAVRVAPRRERTVQAIVDAKLLTDREPQVRLAALLALAEIPSSKVGALALVETLKDGDLVMDRPLWDATLCAAAAHAEPFLLAINSPGASAIARSKEVRELLGRVASHYSRGGPKDTIAGVFAALAASHSPFVDAILPAIAKDWPSSQRIHVDSALEKSIQTLFPRLSTENQGKLAVLTARWGSSALENRLASIRASMRQVLQNEQADAKTRADAARQLVSLTPTDVAAVQAVLEFLNARAEPGFAAGLLEAVRESQAQAAGLRLVERLPSMTPASRTAAIATLLSRGEWTPALLDSLDKGISSWNELTLEQRQALSNHPHKGIAERARSLLARGGALPDADRQKLIDQFAPLAAKSGDAILGKVVFQNHCSKCHQHQGEGTKIGPDLSGVAVHPKLHLLSEILDPNRGVEGTFRLYTVATKSGRVFSGMLVSESRTALEIVDIEAKTHVIARDDLEELQATTKSLMPEGFEKQLSPVDLTNLLEFLSTPGRFLPLPLAAVATVTTTRGMFHSQSADAERLIFDNWGPVVFEGVPFQLTDPQGDRIPNAILLHSVNGEIPPRMPKAVRLPCRSPANRIHLLSGVSGWGYPFAAKGTVSLIVRLHYDNGTTEDHPLKNGEHFADYIRRVDVPGSKFAFALRSQQLRYLAVQPRRKARINEIEFIKGPDATAPIVMAVTVESTP